MDHGLACRVCGQSLGAPAVDGIRDWEYGFPGTFAYRPCTDCGVLQLWPFPELADLIRAYQVDYHGYAAPGTKGRLYTALFRLVERLTLAGLRQTMRPGTKALDIGCGIGLFLEALRKAGVEDLEGVDFSERAAQAVQARGIPCRLGSFLEQDFPAKAYDLLVMNNYLEHVLSPGEELGKARLLLAPGGHLIGETPNFASCDRRLFGRFWGGNHVPRHTFQYTPQSLTRLLREAGFTWVRITHPLNTSHFALSIQNLLQSKAPDLAGNPQLRHGRAWYYPPLMLALLPFNAICALAGRAGFMRFEAGT